MKRFILIIALIMGTVSLSWSQKVITKKLDVQDKTAELKFDFADTIHIEAWNKSTIELEVTINIENNRYNDYYALNVNEHSGNVELVEKVDFDGIKKIKNTKELNNINSKINYKLKVPVDLEFSLKTISGKIELIGSKGKMSVNSISGFIDYAIPAATKAHINLSTVTGDVYSDVKFDNKPSKEISWVGTKRDLSLNGGTLPVELKTVSGDIYLRKLKSVN
jgi:DUF4097 and DUF4098 domain-containing protein YvlB